MNGKVSLGVSRPAGGCTRCVGPNISWTRWLEEGGGFLPPPPPLFEGPKCLRGVGVKDCTWAPPMGEKGVFVSLCPPPPPDVPMLSCFLYHTILLKECTEECHWPPQPKVRKQGQPFILNGSHVLFCGELNQRLSDGVRGVYIKCSRIPF